ncbi:AAA family ATPase [Proteus vulgaris]|nr:AAA family ATPase [Proteus vulgaris]
MANLITKIRNVNIEKFRGLNNISIELGERITVICGKNGTSKSTILGIVAQIFNFETDYTKLDPDTSKPIDLTGYKSLAGKAFTSKFKEHFRLSKQFDVSGSMDTSFHIYDGAENLELNNLKLGLYLRTSPDSNGEGIRATVRNNTKTNNASDSRKVTHPVIFLSLKRLTPITERIKYEVTDIQKFMEDNKRGFIHDSLHILGRRSGTNQLTQTKGTIDSMVVSGNNYDHESVSVGEDNIGQILQAVYSFKKLKEEYPDYHGGLILIDEIDAGLFPAAQRRLIEKLAKYARELNLQIIMTSHSPNIIDTIYEYGIRDKRNYKVCYLSNTDGGVTVKHDYSWDDILLELKNEPKNIEDNISQEKINVFFEDKQNYDFYNSLITKNNLKKYLNPLKDINLGCENYKILLKKKFPGLYDSSIIVFDGDVKAINKYHNAITLPTKLPPDQLLFEYLYNLPREHEFWKNKYKYTKDVFLEKSDAVIRLLNAEEEKIDLTKLQNEIKAIDGKKPREIFKEFSKETILQKLIDKGGVNYNPYRCWVRDNPRLAEKFISEFIDCMVFILSSKYHLNSDEVKNTILGN